jgi:hypothetical protein
VSQKNAQAVTTVIQQNRASRLVETNGISWWVFNFTTFFNTVKRGNLEHFFNGNPYFQMNAWKNRFCDLGHLFLFWAKHPIFHFIILDRIIHSFSDLDRDFWFFAIASVDCGGSTIIKILDQAPSGPPNFGAKMLFEWFQ